MELPLLFHGHYFHYGKEKAEPSVPYILLSLGHIKSINRLLFNALDLENIVILHPGNWKKLAKIQNLTQ